MWLFRLYILVIHLESFCTVKVPDPHRFKGETTSGSVTWNANTEVNNSLKKLNYSRRAFRDKHFTNDFTDPLDILDKHSVSFRPMTEFMKDLSGEESDISNHLKSKMKPCMTPKYMVNLYRRFSSIPHYSGPEIVRSYVNLFTEDHDRTFYDSKGTQIRKHILVFNISGVEMDEAIRHAQLRLHTVLKKHSNRVGKIIRKISIWELERSPNSHKETKIAVDRRSFQGPKKSGWHIFSLTKQVTEWIKSGTQIHILQVDVDIVKRFGISPDIFDIDTKPSCDREPLLVVFLDKISASNSHKTFEHVDHVQQVDINLLYQNYAQIESLKNVTFLRRRKRGIRKQKRKRKYRRNICRKRRRYIDFQEIGWHSWVIAPRGYLANECVGKCYFPIPSHLTPTKYAIIKTLLHLHRREVPSADCVPTTMGPISMLYIDKGAIVYQYAFSGMVVKDCGCR